MIEDLGNWVLFYFACMMLHRIYSATLDDNQKIMSGSRLLALWLGCDGAICLGELTSSADRRLDKALGAGPLTQLFGC